MTRDIPVHIKFADDVNAWETYNNPTVATTRVQNSLDKILSWNRKWQLILSKDRTKVICFTRKGHHDVTICVDNFEQVISKTFDEHLTFSEHINYACSKASKALNRISIFLSTTDGLNARNCIKLYKALVRPHLEHAYPAWCSIKDSDMCKLEQIHRQALLKATGCLRTTPTAALEIITNVIPL